MTASAGDRLRAVPQDFDPAAVAAIDERLRSVREDHGVAIGLAIESGSRAWGFPSPDSDYDCRFIFVRPMDDYLSPWPKRDVVETPLDGELDVNGWDLGKALKLLLKGNAVVAEWLMSPIVYDGDAAFKAELLDLASNYSSRAGVARHYLHLGERQRRTYFGDGRSVEMKKMFYALRPAAALRWLRTHPRAPFPPMHFPTLIENCDAPAEVRALAAELIERKAITREMGAGPLPGPIRDFIDSEFEIARSTLDPAAAKLTPQARAAAEAFFRTAAARLH